MPNGIVSIGGVVINSDFNHLAYSVIVYALPSQISFCLLELPYDAYQNKALLVNNLLQAQPSEQSSQYRHFTNFAQWDFRVQQNSNSFHSLLSDLQISKCILSSFRMIQFASELIAYNTN